MRDSECMPSSPGTIVWVILSPDSDRTVIIRIKRTCGEMIVQGEDEGFIIFWHAELLGWIVCWKQGAKKAVESAFEYETNVADLHGPIWIFWPWLPKCISVRRIPYCKLFAEDIVVGDRHRGLQETRELSTPVRVGREGGIVENLTHQTQIYPTRMVRQYSTPE